MKRQAIGMGACKEGTEGWGEPDVQGLIDKYLHNIGFCIRHDWPSPGFMKKTVPEELLHVNNIFIDDDVHARNLRCMAVLNGRCRGMLMFDGFSSCTVYVRHDSIVHIDCSRFSKVFISVHDRAKVTVVQHGASSVYVYEHGDGCEINCIGNISRRKSVNVI